MTFNWLSIGLAALVPMVIGFLWYSKALFGKVWMKSLNFTDEDLKGGNMAVTLLVALVLSFFLSVFLHFDVLRHHASEEFSADVVFTHGLFHGTMIGILVAVPVLVTNSLFEKKNASNMLINSAYWIVTCALMSGIQFAFGAA